MKTESKGNGSFKLDSLAQVERAEEEGVWVDIEHPSGDPLYLGGQDKTPLRIKVAGGYSKTYRDQEERQNKEVFQAARQGRKLNMEGAQQKARVLAAVCTLEWEGAFDDEGREIPLTKENAVMLYQAARFIYDQVMATIGDHERFFAKSSAN